MNKSNTEKDSNIIKAIVLSEFGEEGPLPTVILTEDSSINKNSCLLISMKTISLLMGDATYQNSHDIEGINYFGVIPFPDHNLTGLTYFFLDPDPNARGKARATTITILVPNVKRTFLYDNMKFLRVVLDSTATKIQSTLNHDKYKGFIESLREELLEFVGKIESPFSYKRKVKIVFAGLDKAGKSSFLLGVKKQFSEIIKQMPTKGVDRSPEDLLTESNSTVVIWDMGGQEKYLDRYFEQSKIYLYNIDLLFFFIDIQDDQRYKESLALYRRIIRTLRDFKEFPIIVVCLNKYDPDLKKSKKVKKHVHMLKSRIQDISDEFFVKLFRTSIFSQWSLISAYSFGLNQLSPNKELFRRQLKGFAEKTKADALLLLNENGIILSNYSKDSISQKVFEISAPHFQTLYETFKEFKLLEKDFIISSGVMNESKKLIYKRIKVDKYNLYLLILLEERTNINQIEKNLPDLASNLIELKNTYL
ncbi:MAG: hypothetical protein EU547_02265 [Promethearchaeota archaeon]|nr:MAG: hypothetical protein EU547_02265 [Candidatus Lokiarchaeota archaeon]